METQPQRATELDLHDLESKLGHTLPTEYREFLLEYNGLSLPYPHAKFDLPGGHGDVGRIEQFFPVTGYGNLLEEQDGYDFNKCVPQEFICISEWNGWYRVSICIAGPDRGAVFWWDGFRSGRPEGTPPSREQLKKVANDFREFWGKLEPDDQ